MYYNGCFFTKNPSQALSGKRGKLTKSEPTRWKRSKSVLLNCAGAASTTKGNSTKQCLGNIRMTRMLSHGYSDDSTISER